MKKWKKTLGMTMALTLAITAIPIAAKVEAAATVTPALAKTPGKNNPLFTQKFGADPFAMVYNGRVYVYMTNDTFEYNADGTIKDNGYGKINKITVVSSDDMVNWTDHGEIPVAGGEGAAKWANNSWAPAAAHKTIDGKEKFFLYFADSANGIGVLEADSPIGPFKDPIGKPLVSRSTPGASDVTWLFDPAVLVDDDGSGYIYFGGGIPTGKDADPGTARVAKLGADMTSLDLDASGGSVKPINPPWLFEDSGINKYNGKYYYSYCTNFSAGHPSDIPTGTIAYMVSDNPMGPFTYEKTILPNPATFFGVGGNNHHAMFELNGKWYITYHAQTLAKAMAESGMYPQMGGQPHGYRNAHINQVSFDENGVIQNITGDYNGVSQLKNVDPYTRVEAETIGWNGGISTESTAETGGMVDSINLAVSSINDGDWTAVSKVDFGADGAGTFTANVASGSSGGTVELHLDSADGALIGTLPISNTGGENSWKTETTNVSGAAGVHDLYMVYRGASTTDNLFKLDYWQFAQKSAAHDLVAINAYTDKYKIDTVSGTDTATMNVKAIYADGTSEDVTSQAAASPAPSGIVSVNSGVVTGVGYGSASIDVSYGGKTDTVNMLVKDLNSELTVKQITVDNPSVALDSGKTAAFKVTAEYADGHTEDVTNTATYSNASPGIAEVSNGTITAKASGTTNVVVSYKGELGDAVTAQITVTVNTPSVVAIEAETAAENTANAYVSGVIQDHTWSLVDGQSTKAMLFGPDNGLAMTGTDAATLASGSRLGYKINFTKGGIYNVWILAKSVDYNSDSIHVGLDNQYKFTANGIEGVSGSQFKWVNLSNGGSVVTGGTSLNITAGVHELNFWGREDGLIIDRILLTTSSSSTDPVWPSTPNGVVLGGPAEAALGSTFDMNYGLSGMDQNIYGQDITFTYDPTQIKFESAESVNPEEVVIVDKAQKQGEVRFIVATLGQNAHLDGNLLNIHWKVKNDTAATASTISLSKGIIADETGLERELENRSYTVQLSGVVVDKTALLTLIADAQSKYDAAVEGSHAGQYPAGSKALLQAAIDQAKAVADNNAATQEQVEQAVSALTAALQSFMDSVITTQPGDSNGDGHYSVGDLGVIAAAYGKTSSDPNWSSYKNADLNNDGKIDIEDLAALARKILNLE